jgi:hypothetical protein
MLSISLRIEDMTLIKKTHMQNYTQHSIITILKYVVLSIGLFSIFFSSSIFAFETKQVDPNQPTIIPRYDMANYDEAIEKLLSENTNVHSIERRIVKFSESFLGQPYLLGALGEGPNGKYDRGPLYRTDSFDCVTYVSTVLALAESHSLAQFKHNIRLINYQDGKVSHITRNHFTSTDFNFYNTYNGFLRDITYKLINPQGKPAAEIADTIINKPAWFRSFKANHLRLFENSSKTATEQLLNDLHEEANKVHNEKSVMLYIPLNELFDGGGRPIMQLFDQIPNGSVIEIVRPNWDLVTLIGTRLNVSHLGFAIRTKKGLVYREASTEIKQVVDVPLTDYLKNYLRSTTVKGINVQVVPVRH